jgi:hypothetical protein
MPALAAVTVCTFWIEDGAVIVPMAGLTDHVTDVSGEPETLAPNAWICAGRAVTLVGLIAIDGAASA